MDIDSDSDHEQEIEVPEQPQLLDLPQEELQLVEVHENPEWWRGDAGARGEVQ